MVDTNTGPASSDVVRMLVQAAQDSARFALENYSTGSASALLQSIVASGTAVEMLLKAALAQHAPALLAERGDPHTVLWLSGQGGLQGKRGFLDCRTITPLEAKRTLAAINPETVSASPDIDVILDRRNAATHLAWASYEDAAAAARSLACVVPQLLSVLSITPDDFWGTLLLNHARTLAQEILDERRLELSQVLTRAQQRWDRLKDLGAEATEVWVKEIAAPEGETVDDEDGFRAAHECPICGNWAWLSGDVARHGVRIEQNDWADEVYVDYLVDRSWRPHLYECRVCGLRLQPPLLALAGFPTDEDLEPTQATPDEIEEAEWESREYEERDWYWRQTR